MTIDPLEQGRLSLTLTARHGTKGIDPEAALPIRNPDRLIYTLGKAAELEHLVVCMYLFAAFSLKRETSEGLTAEQAAFTGGWYRELMHIAEQEMLHLALVQNLLTAVGAGPHFGRPNFPVPPRAFPARLRIELLPFGEEALRHFAFLERPEGSDIEDAEMYSALERATALPDVVEDEIGPIISDFET